MYNIVQCKTLDSCRYWRITWGSQNYEKFEGSTNLWKALLPPSQRCFKMMNTEYCWLGWKLSKTVSVWALQLVCTKLFLYSICSKVPHKFVLSAKPSIKLNLLFRRQFSFNRKCRHLWQLTAWLLHSAHLLPSYQTKSQMNLTHKYVAL